MSNSLSVERDEPVPAAGADSNLSHPSAAGCLVVLCLAESTSDRARTREAIEAKGGIRVIDADRTLSLRAQLERDGIDALLCCLTQSPRHDVDVLAVMAAAHPEVPVLILADPGMEERADEAILHGAWSYVIRTPHFAHRLSHLLRTAVAQRRLVEEKHRSDTSLKLALRARQVMAECNRVLLRAADEQTLLDDMCRIVVEVGGYPMAWIGWPPGDDTQRIRPVAVSGDDRGFLKSLAPSWGAPAGHGGLARPAIRSGHSQIARSVRTDPRLVQWRDAAIACDVRAAAALPLVFAGSVVGVLSIYACEEHAFDDAEVALLEELAGDIAYGICNLRTLRERTRAEAELRESESRFEATFSQAAVGIAHVDLTGRFLRVNASYCALLGYVPEELRNRNFLEVTSSDDVDSSRLLLSHFRQGSASPLALEKRFIRKDGSVVWAAISVSRAATASGEPDYLIAVAQDISARKATEEQLAFLVLYDPLTRLPNRRMVLNRLEQALEEAASTGQRVGVIFLDLDRFKDINDTLGHGTADALLVQVARRLEECVREADTVGRLGGDEFTILVPGINYADEEGVVAQRILDGLATPLYVEGKRIHVSASLGISLYPTDGARAETLLRHADAAMYEAKLSGRGQIRHYLPSMSSRAADRIRLEADLRRALERDEFVLHYQPKFDVKSGFICGLEALLRWQHPERGIVAPAAIIPVLETTGLIIPAGEWILRSVCAQYVEWRRQQLDPPPIAVNVSARQFQQPILDQVIGAILRDFGLKPSAVQVELTESALMSEVEDSVRALANLKAAGLTLAVDDFGTGYSSLAYLSRLPVDALKIDRTFVRNITADATDAAITTAIIKLAHSLGMRVVAEGVETREQLEFLRAGGCDEIQGFLVAPPLTAAECTTALREQWHLP